MIREDYIIDWIKRYVRMLAQIVGLVKTEQYQAALGAIEGALQTLLDLGPDAVLSLSEGQILARLTIGGPTQIVREKCVVLAALLDQLGIVGAAQNRREESVECHLKALHIMLGLRLGEETLPLPDYAPRIEDLAARLKERHLPGRTSAALMLYYESQGSFAPAEDALYAMLDADPANATAVEIGVAFYERLLARSDAELIAGQLPRGEVEEGLAKIRADHPGGSSTP
jgi:tetratricopeptide (TPR) repeat protein